MNQPASRALLLFSVLLSGCATQSRVAPQLESPHGTHRVEFSLTPDQSIQARVLREGQIIVETIDFGFDLKGAPDIGSGLRIMDVQKRRIDETYPIVLGRSTQGRNHYEELILGLKEIAPPEREFELQVRAYEEGVAFRYAFTEVPDTAPIEIIEERSRIQFPADHETWISTWGWPHNSNEREFWKTKISKVAPKQWLQTPVTVVRDDGVAISLYQAALADYAGMYFRKVEGDALAYQTRLVPPPGGKIKVTATIREPQLTPWRVIHTADNALALLDSEFVLNLNPPSRIEDSSWIQAGKMTFPWWANFESGIEGVGPGNTFETAKAFIDFAASHGIKYHVVEPPWYQTASNKEDGEPGPKTSDPLKPMEDIRIHELIKYANARGVDIFLWIHKSLLEENPDEIMRTYKSWGAVGMKVDFFDRLDQETVALYHSLAEKAAAHELMLFYHGAYTPTGMRRTWPNIVTREAVMGNEYNKWSDRVTLEQGVIIPFTRMVPGPMDYTPGGFRNVMPDDFEVNRNQPMVIGTRSRELAKFVVYDSPIQMVCDAPGAYLGQPGVDFLALVPSTWDATLPLQGEIGQHILIARRKGDNWYLGAMTGEEARTFSIPLDFLESGRAYRFTQWSDDPEGPATALIKTSGLCQGGPSEKLQVRGERGGGAVLRLEALADNYFE